MLSVNENSSLCTFHIRWNEWVRLQGSQNDSSSKDQLKRSISPFLEVDFKKFYHNHM